MLSRKAQSLKPSPTLAIAAKAKELAAQGHNVIGLSVGEPDWDTFENIKLAGINAIQAGQTKYAPSNGTPQLRTAIAHKTNSLLGTNYTANEVTVSTGAKFVLFSAFQTLLDPGDEVLIPAPYWVSYPTMVELVDGKPVIVDSDEMNGYKVLAHHLAKKITPKTKMLLLNSPSNPTGLIYTKEEIADIAALLKKHPKIVIVSDDIYNQLVFTGEKVAPHLLQAAPELKDRLIAVNGVSKTYSMTGWRLGWALGPEAVVKAMTNYQSQTVSCAAPFTQAAAVAALQGPDTEIDRHVEILRKRRDLFVEGLNGIKGWKVAHAPGAFYLWADVRALLGKRYQDKELKGAADIATALLDAQKVAVVPGNESGLEGFLRLSFALGEKDLHEAVVRIAHFTDTLQ